LPFFHFPRIPTSKIGELLGISAMLAAKRRRHRVLHRIGERMDPVPHTAGFKSTGLLPKLASSPAGPDQNTLQKISPVVAALMREGV
jgi:hypothetical protein